MPVTTLPVPSGIKSVQRGQITITSPATSNTAVIAAVNTAKAEVRLLGVVNTGTPAAASATVELTNSTTVTAAIGSANGSYPTVVKFEVSEWY